MAAAGIFKVGEILRHEVDEHSFSEMLLRGIRWFANAQTQIIRENRLLNLTTCLEVFLTPPAGEKIANAVAEGVAFVLTTDPKERKRLKEKTRQLYDKRSRASHGGRSTVSKADLTDLERIVSLFLQAMIHNTHDFKERKDLDNWIEEQKFK